MHPGTPTEVEREPTGPDLGQRRARGSSSFATVATVTTVATNT